MSAKKQRYWLWSPLPYLFFGVLSSIYIYVVVHYSLSSSDGDGDGIRRMQPPHSEQWESKPYHDLKTPELSACLIIMDDNHFLIEWIAYHYHKVNLRHLIITSDPNSKTKPIKILDRWKDRIKIEEWNETRFLSKTFSKMVKAQSTGKNGEKLASHRVRQSNFNLECLKSFKRQNRGWTLLIDSDEYLLANDYADNETSTNVLTLLGELNIPNTSLFSSVYSPCLPIHRVQFSARESPIEKVQQMVPPGFHGNDFQTMRWRKFGLNETWLKTHWGATCGIVRHIPNKVMIDLRRLKPSELSKSRNSGNPHQPLTICPKNVYSSILETPFVLNHYMGTPEQWFYRAGDKRGIGYRRARYEDYNQRLGATGTDLIRPWLDGFVARVGNAEAKRLLEDVGKLEPLPGINIAESKESEQNRPKYKIGDVVDVNYAGAGKWQPGEIYAIYSDNFYSVAFKDCTQEIATFADRMKPLK